MERLSNPDEDGETPASTQAAAEPLPSRSIGTKLRLRRRQRRLSLQSVADAAGISIGQLSQIERGLSQPSLRSMRLICEALQMPISWLFNGPQTAPASPIVVRRTERRSFDLGPGGVAKELMSDDAWRGIQMMSVTIPPGGHSGEKPYATGSAGRTGVVLAGRLGLEVDGEQFELDQGDAFTFEDRNECRFWCVGEEACKVIWVVAPAIY